MKRDKINCSSDISICLHICMCYCKANNYAVPSEFNPLVCLFFRQLSAQLQKICNQLNNGTVAFLMGITQAAYAFIHESSAQLP